MPVLTPEEARAQGYERWGPNSPTAAALERHIAIRETQEQRRYSRVVVDNDGYPERLARENGWRFVIWRKESTRSQHTAPKPIKSRSSSRQKFLSEAFLFISILLYYFRLTLHDFYFSLFPNAFDTENLMAYGMPSAGWQISFFYLQLSHSFS